MQSASSTAKKYKALFVDDEPTFLEMYSIRFGADIFEVKTVKNSKEVIETARSFRPDIIFLDLVMKDADGLTLLKQLKNTVETKWMPVVMLSNIDNPADKAEAEKEGASQFLIKSNFTPGSLLAFAKDVLKRR